MIAPLRRARVLGAALALGMFALGVTAGWRFRPQPAGGPRIMITATDAVPTDLERLSLTTVQRDSVQAAIRRGRDRVLRVVDEFDPRMRAALDTTDAEIRALLDPAQQTRFDSLRRGNSRQMERRFIRPESATGQNGKQK